MVSSNTTTTYLITGASRGIGLHLVYVLVQRQADSVVFAAARNKQQIKDNLAKQFPDLTHQQLSRIHYVTLDVDDDSSIALARKEVGETLQRLNLSGINVLLHNAAIVGNGDTFAQITRKSLLDILNTNVAGVIAVTQAFQYLVEAAEAHRKGSAKVAIIGSAAGSIGIALDSLKQDHNTAYRISKTAVHGAAVIALQPVFNAKGIPVYTLHPGLVATDGLKQVGVDLNEFKEKGYNLIEPIDSATGLVKVLETVKYDDQKKLLSYDGTDFPW